MDNSNSKNTYSRPLTMADILEDDNVPNCNYNQNSNKTSKEQNFYSVSSKCKP